MAVPYPSVEKCLEESTPLRNAGNEALKMQEYHEALRLYREAFRHLMIICEGRRRSIWSGAYFQKQCVGGTFDWARWSDGSFRSTVAARFQPVMALLKLEDYEEAKFWGMRSINLMRGGMDGDEVMLGFEGAPEIGKIYYRTGVACGELGGVFGARDLMKIAAKYLPNDKIVQRDLAAFSPRIM